MAFEALGITTIEDFITLRAEDFNLVEFQEFTKNPVTPGVAEEASWTYEKRRLTTVEGRILESLQLWYQDASYRDPLPDRVYLKWFELSQDKFTKWRRQYNPPAEVAARIWAESQRPPPTVNVTGGGLGGGNVVPVVQASQEEKDLESFKKQMKRDPKEFLPLKEDYMYYDWLWKIKATAKSQGVDRVLDLTLDPTTFTGANLALYEQQTTYLFKVLSDTLKTSQGKSFVLASSATQDGRAVFERLDNYYTASRHAELAVQKLTDDIQKLRLDKDYKGTSSSFLVNWMGMIYKLNQCKDAQNQVSTSTKLGWIKCSLQDHKELAGGINNHIANINNLKSMFTAAEKPELYNEEIQWLQIIDRLTTVATEFDANSKDTRAKERAVNTAGRGGRGRESGRGTRGGRGDRNAARGRGGRTSQATESTWVDPELWKAMTKEQQEATKAKNQTARLKAARENKDRTERHLNSLLQKASGGSEVPTAVTVPARVETKTPVTFDLNSLQGSSANTTITTHQQGGTRLVNLLRNSTVPSSIPHNSTGLSNTLTQGNVVTRADGSSYLEIAMNMAQRSYRVTMASKSEKGALVDRGANGGLAGADMRPIEYVFGSTVDVTGVGNSLLSDLPLVQAASLIQTKRGPIIGLFNQYAYTGEGRSIHSSIQMEAWGVEVSETSRNARVPGKQRLTTIDGHRIPISIRNGLPFIDMTYPTDEDMVRYPQVHFTSEQNWDPTILDDENSLDTDSDDEEYRRPYLDPDVNDFGELHSLRNERAYIAQELTGDIEYDIDQLLYEVRHELQDNNKGVYTNTQAYAVKQERHFPKFEILRPNFGWISADRIKKTLGATTQFMRTTVTFPFRHHYKTRCPAANVRRFNDDVAMDTMFCDVPALDDGILGHGGCTMAQVYCGRRTQLTKVYGMQLESQMPETLQDFIRDVGAPNLLISDNSKVQIGAKTRSLLRYFEIKDHQSEPHYQNQNYAERRIQEIKRFCNTIMDRTGTPPELWLLCLLFVVFLMNHLSTESLGGITPIEAAFNIKPDTSPLLGFHWYQPVLYDDSRNPGSTFPRTSKEKSGRWVGVAETKGDLMTYYVLDDVTKQVLTRSGVRPVTDTDPNLRTFAHGGEEENDIILDDIDPTIKSSGDYRPGATYPRDNLPHFSPEALIGASFLMKESEEDGQILRAKIVHAIKQKDKEGKEKALKFLVSYGDDEYQRIMEYNDICDIMEKQREADESGESEQYAFRAIVGHDGPLKPGNPKYNGSTWNLLVHWEDGSQTWEPMTILAKDDRVSVAKYGLDNDLLDKPGWKRLKAITRRKVHFQRMVNQSKVAPSRHIPVYKFGVRIPRNIKEARMMDMEVGNRRWQEACDLEIIKLHQYHCFKSQGKNGRVPKGFQCIKLIWVFDVKHDLRHRARLVAGGHMTEALKESSYSGVVSLRSLRLCILIAELNGLFIEAADISSAYLEAYTKEKVCFLAGEEFGELAGHILIIVKALYGLRSSGARWHERFADTLRDCGFFPSRGDPDVWMRDCGEHYEYICVYVDDIAIMSKNPSALIDLIKAKGGYQLSSGGPISYHIGGDFKRDEDGVLCYGCTTYIERMVSNYHRLFGENPRKHDSPLPTNCHPELDESELLDENGIKQYQSIIGALQWAVSLCRLDIGCAIMTMGRFRTQPRKGHLALIQHITGYLYKFKHAALKFNVREPDYTGLQEMPQDWTYSVYGKVKEDIPRDIPTPKGNFVVLTCFVDANLMHDYVTGRSATGILHLVNSTIVDWYSKRQDTVESATYGSEFVAARIATEQIMDIRNTLRYFGVPVRDKTYMFGDNQSVVTSSTLPHSVLKKRHNLLSYHRVREAIAAGVLKFFHIFGTENPSDVLTKHLGHSVAYRLLRPYLFPIYATSE